MAATDTEILARLRLINTDGIGPVTFYKLLKTCRSAENALRSLPPKFHPAPLAAAEREISLARAKGIKILAFDNPEYPQKLRELEDAPPFLYVKGRTDILNRSPAVSVVGARNASINGRKLASRIAYDLTGAGVLIVSRMARGIDAASHKGAMYALEQNGPTVAVLGTGADIVYPAENFSLYEQIAAQGAVISEFPLGTEAQSGNFPRRNRIVSALADAVLVVEAVQRQRQAVQRDARGVCRVRVRCFAVPHGHPRAGLREGNAALAELLRRQRQTVQRPCLEQRAVPGGQRRPRPDGF